METHLYLAEHMQRPRSLALGAGLVAAWTAPRPGREGPNEDAAAVVELGSGGVVLMVADGVGGHRDARQASNLALRTLVQELERAEEEQRTVRDALLDGIEKANRAVVLMGTGAGTTLAVASIVDEQVRTYHVGDAAVLLAGQRGRLKLLTISHSPVGYAIEAGVIGEEEALRHEDRSLISNMVGAEDMRVEMAWPSRLAPRDTLVLGSDGLFDNLSTDEIVQAVRRGPLDAAAERLVAGCAERMAGTDPERPCKPDDCTFLLYRPTTARPARTPRARPAADPPEA